VHCSRCRVRSHEKRSHGQDSEQRSGERHLQCNDHPKPRALRVACASQRIFRKENGDVGSTVFYDLGESAFNACRCTRYAIQNQAFLTANRLVQVIGPRVGDANKSPFQWRRALTAFAKIAELRRLAKGCKPGSTGNQRALGRA